MQRFDYARPRHLDEALVLLDAEGSVPLAGGTDLLPLMKDGALAPRLLVDIKRLAALQGISTDPAGSIRIGSTVTLGELLTHAGLRAAFPALIAAADQIRGASLRSRGTVGGELCRWPDCWYFRAGHGLAARGARETAVDGPSMAEAGDNRYHAVLGNTTLQYVNASLLAPVLLALGARARVAGPAGERRVPLHEIYRTPDLKAPRELALGRGELLLGIELHPERVFDRSGTHGAAVHQVRTRAGVDQPLVSAAAVLQMDGDVIAHSRLFLGQVAPLPWRAREAEQVLRGKPAVARVAEVAAEQEMRLARGLSGNQYKIRLAAVSLRRAILAAAGTP